MTKEALQEFLIARTQLLPVSTLHVGVPYEPVASPNAVSVA